MPTDAAADGSTATQDATATDAAQGEQQEATIEEFVFDTWIGTQPEHIKTGLDKHVHGLKSALESERNSRTNLEKQIKTLGKAAGEGTELKEQLDKLSGDLVEERIKNQFFLDAHEAKVTNVKLAWLAAKAEELIDSKGVADFATLRQSNPELFAIAKTVVPPGNQGNGRGQEGERKVTMNDLIRQAAGRTAS